MTKLDKIRDEDALNYLGNYCPDTEVGWEKKNDFKAGFSAAVATLLPEINKLVEAAKAWVEYEKEGIIKEGPYSEFSKIPRHIAANEHALTQWNEFIKGDGE